MTPNEYQKLASRTECNQLAAARRREAADYPAQRYDPQRERWIDSSPSGDPSLLATRLSHAALGLAGEAGELCYAVEKWLHYGKPLDTTNVLEEVGDALWYLALACNACGLSLEEAMERNIAKLRQRYPDKYSDQLAAEENRDRASERTVLEQPALMTAKDFIAVQTGPKTSTNLLCPGCKTPLSDLAKACPACGTGVACG